MSIIRGAETDIAGIGRIITDLRERYPFLEVSAIGKSVLGREILSVSIGSSASNVLYVGGVHGTNRLTALVLLRFIETLAGALETGGEIAGKPASRVLYGTGVIVVPVANPDGFEISLKGPAGALHLTSRIHMLCDGDFHLWNANARGVDINHNFNAEWDTLRKIERESGIFGPAARRYGGPAAESEPETAALTGLCRGRHFRHMLALMNSMGEAVYWSYGAKTPPKAKKLAGLLAGAAGYAVEEPMGLVTHGGFKEWFIEEFGRPGFTVMVGGLGEKIDPVKFEAAYERLEEMLVLAAVI